VVVAAALGVAATACGTSSGDGEKPAPAQTSTSAASPSSPAASAKQLWVATDAAVATGRPQVPNVVRLSPDGKVVLVAGGGPTVAYDAASGHRLWQAGGEGMSEGAAWLAVSPDGSAVYVIGTVAPDSPDAAYRTVALSMTSGKRLWAATFGGAGAGTHSVASVVATEALVIVDGVAGAGDAGTKVVTVAYDARTGHQKWIAPFDASADGTQGWFPSGARSLAVDPAGTTAYVTTGSQTAGVSHVVTEAYDTATGDRRWSTRYESPDRGNAMGSAVAVSPDGSTVVMTGMSELAKTRTDSVTIGYDAATGKQQWVRTYNGPANQNEGTGLVAFAPDGASVFVAGTSEGATPEHEDMIVLAFDTASGARRWAVRWDGPAGRDDNASDLAVAPDGASVVLVGRTVPEPMKDQFATVGLQPASGAVLWSSTYGITTSAEGNLACNATSVAIAKNGTVFVTGSAGSGSATMAYAPPG
jgi:hypothetical protein